MTHRELIEACANLDAGSLLQRRGARLTNNSLRFSPCPACHEGSDKGRGVCVITSTGKGFRCYAGGSGSGCGAKGSSLDILLLLEGLDPKAQFTPAHYEAMSRELNDHSGAAIQPRTPEPPPPPLFTHAQIQGYYRQMCQGGPGGIVRRWLHETRGIPWESVKTLAAVYYPRQIPASRPDLRAAVEAGPCAAFPLYSTHPKRLGQIMNVVIRPINPTITDPESSRPWKAKCLNAGAGSTRDETWPLVYGDPRGPAPYIVVEGALDQLTVQALAGSSATVIGAFCAADIPRLSMFIYDSDATLISHLDKPTTHYPTGAGQTMTKRLEEMCMGSRLFSWPRLLSHFNLTMEQFAASGASGATDINDLIRTDGPQIATFDQLLEAWRRVNP